MRDKGSTDEWKERAEQRAGGVEEEAGVDAWCHKGDGPRKTQPGDRVQAVPEATDRNGGKGLQGHWPGKKTAGWTQPTQEQFRSPTQGTRKAHQGQALGHRGKGG